MGEVSTVKLLEVTLVTVAVNIAAELTRWAAETSEAVKAPDASAEDREAASEA